MAFPYYDYRGLKKNGFVEICYQGKGFMICRIAQWAYMAVVVLEDTTDDEYEPSCVTLAAWHIDCESGKKIMENNALFTATMRSPQTGRKPDLLVTVTDTQNPLADIYNEVKSGVRKPIEDPGLDLIFKQQETQRLKAFVDRYGENPRFSPKKVWVGMLLLLLYPFGLPFFYFNKPAWGVIMLSAMGVSLIFPPLVFVGGLLGCVLIVMLLIHVLGNNAKDKDGNLICTQKNQKLITESIAKYKKNTEELKNR